jgi:coenzyme F420-reducing hydrogenase delta subunit
VLESFGIEKERVEVVTSFDPEGAKIAALVNEFKQRLKGLEPIRV